MNQMHGFVLVMALGVGEVRAQAPQFFEFEPNESCAAGTPFDTQSGLGGGQLSSTTDVDYFRFSSSATSALTLNVSPQDSIYDGGSIRSSIHDTVGTLLAGRILLSDDGSIPLRAIVGPGTYCIKFERRTDYSIFTKEYRLIAFADASTSALSGLEAEPNDDIGQADAMTSGDVVLAQLAAEADVDLFAIDIPAPHDVVVSVDPETDGYDGSSMLAQIIDAQGDVLAGRIIISDQPAERMLVVRRTGSGRIFARLQRRTDYAVMDRYVQLSTTFDADQSSLHEIEPNAQPGGPTYSGPGVLRGQLSSADDVDVTRVSLLAGVAQFTVSPEDDVYDGGVIIIEIQNDSGGVLASREVTSDASPQIMNVGIATSGIYWVVARRKPDYQHFDKHYLVTLPAGAAIFHNGFE